MQREYTEASEGWEKAVRLHSKRWVCTSYGLHLSGVQLLVVYFVCVNRMLLYSDLWAMKIDKWATSESIHVSTNFCVKLFLLLENALRLNFEALRLTNWKFEPLPRPLPHSDAIDNINTQKNYVWIYHDMHWTLSYKQKLSIMLKSKDLATRGF